MTNANLTGGNLANAELGGATLTNAKFDAETRYNQWTVFPDEFDPVAAGLTFAPSPAGDFNADDGLDVADIDNLTARLNLERSSAPFQLPLWPPNDVFDIDNDNSVSLEDHGFWVKDLKNTWYAASFVTLRVELKNHVCTRRKLVLRTRSLQVTTAVS